MGLYASVVLVIGKFVREFFSGISHTIMFEELPNVDRILKLCTDIFLVRETGELDLEEDMYAKLIFLYRSPETMIKWTREKTQWGDVNLWRRLWAFQKTLGGCSVGVSSYYTVGHLPEGAQSSWRLTLSSAAEWYTKQFFSVTNWYFLFFAN